MLTSLYEKTIIPVEKRLTWKVNGPADGERDEEGRKRGRREEEERKERDEGKGGKRRVSETMRPKVSIKHYTTSTHHQHGHDCAHHPTAL